MRKARDGNVANSIPKRSAGRFVRNRMPRLAAGDIFDLSEREHRRAGKELHGGVCQELAGISFHVQSIQNSLESNGAVTAGELAAVAGLLQSTLKHARGISEALCPINEDPEDLPVALARLANHTSRVHGVACTFIGGEIVPPVDSRTAIHLYRLAQEAVRDSIDRGKATTIQIELGMQGELARLSICDDGVTASRLIGWEGDPSIRVMNERASVIGASMQTDLCNGSSVRVVFDLSLRRKGNR